MSKAKLVPSSNSKVAGYVASFVLAVVGILFLVPSVAAFVSGKASERWNVVHGKVLKLNEHSSKNGRYYSVRYTYQFGERLFEGDRISFGLRSDAECRLLGGITQGSQIHVFADPDDASNSVLIPGVGAGVIWFIVAGAGLFLFGVFTFLLSKRERTS